MSAVRVKLCQQNGGKVKPYPRGRLKSRKILAKRRCGGIMTAFCAKPHDAVVFISISAPHSNEKNIIRIDRDDDDYRRASRAASG
ncbi:hypothetical protein NEIMUCOT_05213 [Neisseria mucosa ATCC 25996]|uniref:Uncharacterized protein n=1 Tax=Neisseria mucosa (strain ATCC 25996 / DSM 4631 / NCTC 10774 / M26) TaxID=546266 RepID=D2ZX64_NEIM2|nr:hypothetical protein NEIMUCOT_05213 [Neisseria mucosa ATCC 25996]